MYLMHLLQIILNVSLIYMYLTSNAFIVKVKEVFDHILYIGLHLQ